MHLMKLTANNQEIFVNPEHVVKVVPVPNGAAPGSYIFLRVPNEEPGHHNPSTMLIVSETANKVAELFGDATRHR